MPVIFDIKRFALHDGPGIRTTVFLKGCPIRCLWCHNPESHSPEIEEYTVKRIVDGKEIIMNRVYGKKASVEEVLEEVLNDKVFYDESGGGVTFSGGEPLMQHEDLIELLKALGTLGIHRTVDTAGVSSPKIIEMVAEHTDLFLYDLKIMDPYMHKKYIGVDNLQILKNADLLLEKGSKVIFRIPLIPGVNDSDEELNSFLEFLSARKGKFSEVHLLPYHKIGSQKYNRMAMKYLLEELQEPSESYIEELKEIIEASGATVSIGG